jgi:hypothetical protein
VTGAVGEMWAHGCGASMSIVRGPRLQAAEKTKNSDDFCTWMPMMAAKAFAGWTTLNTTPPFSDKSRPRLLTLFR